MQNKKPIVIKLNNKLAKDFIIKHHYTHSCAKSTISYGIMLNNKLVGAIVYGQPSGRNLSSSIRHNGNDTNTLELLRLVLLDFLPKNVATWFISRSIILLKIDVPQINLLISYADGSAGHHGYIYQAASWLYIGTGSHEKKFFIDGKRRHRRDLYDVYGTSSMIKLKNLLGERFQVSTIRYDKYKYIKIIAHSKKEKKIIFNNLKVVSLPYPKGDNNKTTNQEWNN